MQTKITADAIQRLKADLIAGRIDRRRFIEGATAFGLTLGAAISVSGQALAATPKKGGTFRAGIAHGSTTDSLDPSTYENTFTSNLCYGLHNHLTELDENDKLVPELAESWEASPDAKTWTFQLRKGVEFHNGKTMTSQDVVDSFNMHRGDNSKSAAKPIVESITDIKADGPNTVVFTLASGNADFPFIASDYHLAIMPSDGAGNVDWASGTGTGGYILKSFEPGVRADLERNPNYWKEGRAHFDAVEMTTIVDIAARTNAMSTNEIDAMDRVEIKTMNLLDRNPNIRIAETTGYAHYSVPMRTDTAPFDNIDVRLALKYAVDREALLETVLRGHGAVGNDHPISIANRYHADNLPQKSYDPDKAKFHLKKAGYSSLTVPLHAADAAFGGAVDAAVLYKEHAKAAGIEIDLVREPNDGYWSNVWMKKPWCMCYWSGRATEDWMFSTAYADGASWNDTFWKHDRFNMLLEQARAELDDAKRREMYVEMQQIVSDEGGVVVPMFNNYIFAMSTKVGTDQNLARNGDLDGNKLLERWWFV
ncbi:MAG: ABC transporter substrate-binding protein [Alphaproteobacteria bacterium]